MSRTVGPGLMGCVLLFNPVLKPLWFSRPGMTDGGFGISVGDPGEEINSAFRDYPQKTTPYL